MQNPGFEKNGIAVAGRNRTETAILKDGDEPELKMRNKERKPIRYETKIDRTPENRYGNGEIRKR